MENICSEIGINLQHVADTSVEQRYQLICDKQWLQTLERKRKISAFPVYPQLDRRAHPEGALEHPWTKILVQIYKKQPHTKAFPLGRSNGDFVGLEDDFGTSLPLTYSQAVFDITQKNFRNIWENTYKNFTGAHLPSENRNRKSNKSRVTTDLLSYDRILRELIQIVFRCPIIHSKLDRDKEEFVSASSAEEHKSNVHSNIMPALIAIETSSHFTVFFYPPCITTSLYDCITYSPAILSKNYNQSLFIIYQIFQLARAMHRQCLLLGDLSLQHILIADNLWILVIPPLESNILIYSPCEDSAIHSTSDAINDLEMDQKCMINLEEEREECLDLKLDLKFAYDLGQFTLRDYCEMWCNGQLSNYDYLTILNNAAGRSLKNPSYHHIMPWVTDFTARNGVNWRDLSKSKYRLNKGDIHLDLMFSHAHCNQLILQEKDQPHTTLQQIPHHVSDFLSEITYFVYMARRTPQHILREHVRPIWVPAEYPVSIQRLQEWTPDECIPEFYSDPMIFKSIHEDLPDLELPSWASCPEDFICKHREALESQYVSERLQHWIDLNFGYKLSGKAAIKSKNVCLSIVDQHKNICRRGIVQLFSQPHPAKFMPNPWFCRQAPRIQNIVPQSLCTTERTPSKKRGKNLPDDSKRLARSSENLHQSSESLDKVETHCTRSVGSNSPRLSVKTHPPNSQEEVNKSSYFYMCTNFIELPKNYNPVALLQSLESMQTFINKTFPLQKRTENAREKLFGSDLLFEDCSDHSFTNQLFDDFSPAELIGNKTKIKTNLASRSLRNSFYSQLKESNIKDLRILGCLIIELFAMARLRPLLSPNFSTKFEERLKACQTIRNLHQQDIPKCLRYITALLLDFNYKDSITDKGLPFPTADQILQPIYYNILVPFPVNYYACYALLRALRSFDVASTLLELYTHFHCNGSDCSQYKEIDCTRVLFERKIAECKVMSCCAHIGSLLEPTAYEQFVPVDILLPHIIELLCNEHTSILTAWNLFDSVAQALGITQTQKQLLQPVMKLYDVESFERGMTSVRNRASNETLINANAQLRFSTSSSFKSRKSVKLYHHSFLLRLIVRFGLKCFLQNFIAPLIEAVGGYKEPEDGNGLHYHSLLNGRRTSRNLSLSIANIDKQEVCPDTLRSAERTDQQFEDNTISEEGEDSKHEIDEVFSFDDDVNSDGHVSASDHISNKSLDSLDMRPTTAEEAKEEDESTPEKLAISEIIYGSKISNNSLEETDKISESRQNVNEMPALATQLGPRSPTMAIPANIFRRSYQLNAIDCDIGSRKSIDSFEIMQEAVDEEEEFSEAQRINRKSLNDEKDKVGTGLESGEDIIDGCDSLQASVISKMSEVKALQNSRIAEMSAESLVWLSHRLGPVLTCRFITKNLLKMLTLCYVGQENLLPESGIASESNNLNFFTVSDARVVGDRSAIRVLECLMSITALYGEQVILLQYFPHISELIAMGTKRITTSLEGAIISTLQLLKYLIPCLMDTTIMEHLKYVFLDAIILPVLKFLNSTNVLMPSGYLGRSVFARKLIDAVYVLCVRIGSDMSREHLCLSVLRPFFQIFDKAYGREASTEGLDNRREIEELRDVFCTALAHSAYLAFLRFLGEETMKRTLLNFEFIITLCHEFEQPHYKSYDMNFSTADDAVDSPTGGRSDFVKEIPVANSFGTQVIGNRLEVTNTKVKETPQHVDSLEVLDMVTYKLEHLPTTRYLKGNWLAYWRHEITRSDKDTDLNLKQIKLQSFVGHTNSVRALLVLDNENSFISASKDKTVKLWSLRSEGDGSKITSCQFTYTAHRKSIHSLTFLESARFVVSCDSGVHMWDPFIGRPLGILDNPRHNAITVVKCLPSPSPLVVAGTAEASVKMIDSRCMQYVNEWRVSPYSPFNATVRCLTVAPSSNWLAVGLSTGSIVMLDTRTGMLMNSWRPMECDLLQLSAPNDQQLISSALDHSLAVWHANDGILHYQLPPPPEPAHYLQTIGSELVYATTGNRIGIYSDLSNSHAMHTVTKLRSENFKGVLTSLAVLPLNRAFLAGNESGNISLLC
uniref:BEACH domain-containing protein n=1 Tax=Glossina brevipalpis TaxID=37001 RepID=A0A1A9WL24_9MUSC